MQSRLDPLACYPPDAEEAAMFRRRSGVGADSRAVFRPPFAYAEALGLKARWSGGPLIWNGQAMKMGVRRAFRSPAPFRYATLPGAIRSVVRRDICIAGQRNMNRVIQSRAQRFQKYGLVGVNPAGLYPGAFSWSLGRERRTGHRAPRPNLS